MLKWCGILLFIMRYQIHIGTTYETKEGAVECNTTLSARAFPLHAVNNMVTDGSRVTTNLVFRSFAISGTVEQAVLSCSALASSRVYHSSNYHLSYRSPLRPEFGYDTQHPGVTSALAAPPIARIFFARQNLAPGLQVRGSCFLVLRLNT